MTARLFLLVPAAWLALALTAGCGDAPAPVQVRALEPPSPAGSQLPYLAARDGRLYMSWIESGERSGGALRLSVLTDGNWSKPRTVVADERMLVNWADFPSFAVGSDGLLAAHWLVRGEEDRFVYDAWLSTSADEGRTWAEPVRLHDDGTATEHGFVTEVANPDGSMGLVWLDGRAMAGDESRMQLMYRRWKPEGFGPEVVLDDDVCTCCQTAGVRAGGDLLVVYRDHEPGEIRDISIVRQSGGQWSDPGTVHRDGWEIGGCPVNGPSIDARGNDVAVAWFTAAGERPRVWLGFSDDGGLEFDEPIRVDDGDPIGRVDVILHEDGSALVSWIERGEDGARVRVRSVRSDRSEGPDWIAGPADAGRSSGFPRMARVGSQIYVAWTDPEPPGRILLSVLSGS